MVVTVQILDAVLQQVIFADYEESEESIELILVYCILVVVSDT